jgi:hypothetical protein
LRAAGEMAASSSSSSTASRPSSSRSAAGEASSAAGEALAGGGGELGGGGGELSGGGGARRRGRRSAAGEASSAAGEALGASRGGARCEEDEGENEASGGGLGGAVEPETVFRGMRRARVRSEARFELRSSARLRGVFRMRSPVVGRPDPG